MPRYTDEEIINIVWTAKVGQPLPWSLSNEEWCYVMEKYGAPIVKGMTYDECFVRSQNFLREIKHGVSGV